MMHYLGFGHGFMGAGWLFQMIILILFFLILIWILRGTNNFGYRMDSKESAAEILKKRLVNDEITSEEYKRIKKEIE